jgi:hypothetical protein
MNGLFLDSGYELPLDLAQATHKGAYINTSLIDRIVGRIRDRGIEAVLLDPLVALHSLSETDNPGHSKLIRTLNIKLAKPCNCLVDINHHTRKLIAARRAQPAYYGRRARRQWL